MKFNLMKFLFGLRLHCVWNISCNTLNMILDLIPSFAFSQRGKWFGQARGWGRDLHEEPTIFIASIYFD